MATVIVKCSKCNGTGFIEAFGHVSGGICFDCRGKGSREVKTTSVSANKAIINKYLQRGYFPENLNAEKIVCFQNHGHPTAEHWLLKNCEFYYVGQPVCRASIWYKIPVADLSTFINAYNKVKKDKISVNV